MEYLFQSGLLLKSLNKMSVPSKYPLGLPHLILNGPSVYLLLALSDLQNHRLIGWLGLEGATQIMQF